MLPLRFSFYMTHSSLLFLLCSICAPLFHHSSSLGIRSFPFSTHHFVEKQFDSFTLHGTFLHSFEMIFCLSHINMSLLSYMLLLSHMLLLFSSLLSSPLSSEVGRARRVLGGVKEKAHTTTLKRTHTEAQSYKHEEADRRRKSE